MPNIINSKNKHAGPSIFTKKNNSRNSAGATFGFKDSSGEEEEKDENMWRNQGLANKFFQPAKPPKLADDTSGKKLIGGQMTITKMVRQNQPANKKRSITDMPMF